MNRKIHNRLKLESGRSKLMSSFVTLLVATLLLSATLPLSAQSQTNPTSQSSTTGTIYLPLITANGAANSAVVTVSDNPMSDLLAQRTAYKAVGAAPLATEPRVTSASQPAEIGPGLYELSSFDPNLPLDDLEALDKIVGNADFVGLGEPFHTNGGSYQMKHRIFRYLVERKGFRVLGFESPFVWVERLDQYLQSCQGPAASALTGNVFSVFNSTEVADLVQWMCEWNQTHPDDRLSVYGFDIQRMARENGEAVIAFLQHLGIGTDDPRVIGIRACDGVVETFWPAQPFPQERYDQCQGALSAVDTYFDENESTIRHQTSREELAWARIHLRSEQAWQEEIRFFATDFLRSYGAREVAMPELIQEIHELRFPHTKVALWAHNGHIATNGVNLLFNDDLGGLPSMGDYVKTSLRHKYVTIGLTGYNLGANWSTAAFCGVFQLLGPNAVETILHNVGPDYLLLDLAPRGNGQPTFLDPNTTNSLTESRQVILADTFDALVYLEDSPAMHALGFAPCP